MIDCILYVPNFPALVEELDEHHPDMLQRDESGAITMPPVVTGFARTPAAQNGNAVLVYARLSASDAETWRSVRNVDVLAERKWLGVGTAELLFNDVFSSPAALAKYETVWQRERTHIDDETGETRVIRQDKFGILGGA